MSFKNLGIIPEILKAVEQEGYDIPSPIQEQAIPVLLKQKDVLASAQTGTGKTAAFSIPIIQGLYEDKLPYDKKYIRALILAPTRELAEQIKDSFRGYSRHMGLKTEVIYGGVSQRSQEVAIRKGVDILVATPGRLLDLINQGLVKLDFVKYLVLDEADHMLDMGFIKDVRKIVSFVKNMHQTMMFSATLPKEILSFANELLTNPIRIEITPPEAMLDIIDHSLYFVTKKDKTRLLIDLLVDPKMKSVLVFTRTKHGANKLVKELLSYGVKADAIHGNKSQNMRQKALNNFKAKQLRVLVATDIAARGIDVDELSHVINYDLPESPETYVHRIGRTGRAKKTGVAISFCSQDEAHLLKAIEKTNQIQIPVITDQPFHTTIRVNETKNELKIIKTQQVSQSRRGSKNTRKKSFSDDKYKKESSYKKTKSKKKYDEKFSKSRSSKKY
ncbi:DEAD/DEAH box helicase [Tenericutes bacterium MZ-XQ]|nr:DEAD/DEAH box helicase [Tenericutes bacterium MZ-XQ]